MVSACVCQAIVHRTQLPCLRKTKTGSDFCGYHNKKKDEDTVECTICMCPIHPNKKRTLITTPCKHVFHKACLNEWTSLGKYSCPLCRGDLGHPPQQRRSGIQVRVEDFLATHDRNGGYALMRVGEYYIASTRLEDGMNYMTILNSSNGVYINL